jgi:hypothetical protein
VINKKLLFKPGKVGIVLGAALCATLSGCVGYVRGPSAEVAVAPPVVEVGVQDNYVYYPSYGIYFNSYRNQYAYMDGGAWVSRPEPMGVSVDVLLASPSVRMDFHDSPANHNAETIRAYPKNWTASGVNHVQKAEVENAQARKASVKKAPAQKPKQKPEKREQPDPK